MLFRSFRSQALTNLPEDSCFEKDYFLSLVNLGHAALIVTRGSIPWDATEDEKLRFSDSLRRNLVDILKSRLKRYASSSIVASRLLDRSIRFTAHGNILITAAGDASIVFAKAFHFIWSIKRGTPYDPATQNIIETAYFTTIFLIRSIYELFSDTNVHHAASHLHNLFSVVLYSWFSSVAKRLILTFLFDLRTPVLLLSSTPSYACVSTVRSS